MNQRHGQLADSVQVTLRTLYEEVWWQVEESLRPPFTAEIVMPSRTIEITISQKERPSRPLTGPLVNPKI